MRITCPQCGFFRELPDNKVPLSSTMATCPKCRHRFRFRPEHDASSPERASSPREDGGSSWRRPGPAVRRDRQASPAVSRDVAGPVEGAAEDGAYADPAGEDRRAVSRDMAREARSLDRVSPGRSPLDVDPDLDEPGFAPLPRRGQADTPPTAAAGRRMPADPDFGDEADDQPLPPVDHWTDRGWQPHNPYPETAGSRQGAADWTRRPEGPDPQDDPEPDAPPSRVRFSEEMAARHEAARHPAGEPPPYDDGPESDEALDRVRFPEELAARREAVRQPAGERPPDDDGSEPYDDGPEPDAPPSPRRDDPVVRPKAAPRAGGSREPYADAPGGGPAASRLPGDSDAAARAAGRPADAASPQEAEPPSGDVSSPPDDGDGVRDIWARLQAMEDEPLRKRREKPQKIRKDDDAGDIAEEGETITDPIPWERQDAYGFFRGLLLTLRLILFRPAEFFQSMPEGRPKGKALVFNLLISEFLLAIDFLWSLFGLRARLGEPGQSDVLGAFAATPSLAFLAALLLVPVVLSVGIYLDAWLTHLLLLLFRSAKKGFNETFRVMCYSAAPTVLSAVPVAGQLLSPIILVWYMALQAIGLKKVHDGAYTQTLAAIFIKWSLYLFLLLAMLQSIAPGH